MCRHTSHPTPTESIALALSVTALLPPIFASARTLSHSISRFSLLERSAQVQWSCRAPVSALFRHRIPDRKHPQLVREGQEPAHSMLTSIADI